MCVVEDDGKLFLASVFVVSMLAPPSLAPAGSTAVQQTPKQTTTMTQILTQHSDTQLNTKVPTTTVCV